VKVFLLVSYNLLRGNSERALRAFQKSLEEIGDYEVWLDSGAFGVARGSGETIRLEDYVAFVKSCPIKVARHFMLDVIGDPEATERNYERHLQLGTTPIPVFTRQRSFDQLHRFLGQAEVVGVGGIAKLHPVPRRRYIGQLVRATTKEERRKLHVLGVAAMDILQAVHPYSCDATSWVSGRRLGVCRLMVNGKVYPMTEKTVREGRLHPVAQRWIRQQGVDLRDVLKREAWHKSDALMTVHLTWLSWLLHSQWLYDRFAVRCLLVQTSQEPLRLTATMRRFGLLPGPVGPAAESGQSDESRSGTVG
jgi:hypothetical protein